MCFDVPRVEKTCFNVMVTFSVACVATMNIAFKLSLQPERRDDVERWPAEGGARDEEASEPPQ